MSPRADLDAIPTELPRLRNLQMRFLQIHVVGTATRHGLDGRRVGVRVPVGARFFSSPRSPDRFRGPPSLLTNGYAAHFAPGWGVKRPGRKAD
jgi:hypothetical protein